MRRTFLTMFLILIAAMPALAGYRGSHDSMSISIDDEDGEITRCDQIRVSFNDERATVTEEQVAGAASLRSLKVRSERNGGVRVTGWDRAGYAVTACKAAANPSTIKDIRASLSGDELTVDGPDGGRWVAYFIVRAPRGAVLDLSAHNGEIGLQRVDGTVTARAQNGPISIKDSSGSLDITTQNGPISIAGTSGTVRLAAQNGPIDVKLSGRGWDGGSLEAHTQNGPLSLKIPRNYASGVVVESDGHGPISCRAEACRNSPRSWHDDDDFRRIELGGSDQRVKLSTKNGPVMVKEGE